MASFRVLNQAPQYLLADGSVNTGGKLFFYETDLTTPRNTWSDEAMTVLNSNPVVMDAAGRTLTDVWGDGEYGVVMSDADDVVIWTRNNVKADGDAALSLPALLDGQFWTSDGSSILATYIIQVPDPTGFAGKTLYSDGSLSYWGDTPEAPELDVVVAANSLRVGDGSSTTKMLMQSGAGSAVASGSHVTSVAVTFATAYTVAPVVLVNGTIASITPSGFAPVPVAINITTTGFTASFDVNDSASSAAYNITSPVTFNWLAFGTVAVP